MIDLILRNDLEWWRTIVWIARDQPSFLGASIEAVRRCKRVDIYLRTDASTSTGGGCYLSLTQGGEPIMSDDKVAIRWTKREMEIFAAQQVSINVLEFYAAVYLILQWASALRGKNNISRDG